MTANTNDRPPPSLLDASASSELLDRFGLAMHCARRNGRSHAISRVLLPTVRQIAARTLAECAARGIRITLEEDANG